MEQRHHETLWRGYWPPEIPVIPPTKDQADIGQDNQTLDASDSPTNKDTARQEFKQEADINYMLSRFGVTQPRGTPMYGTWDDSIDLMTAIAAVEEARAGYLKLPTILRRKFKSMEELLSAVESGALVLKDEEAPLPQKTPMDLANERIAKLEKDLTAAAAPA